MSTAGPHSDAYRDMVLGPDTAKHVAHIEESLRMLRAIQRRNAAAVRRNAARKASKS